MSCPPHVADYRFGRNVRNQWLSASEFREFARHILHRGAEVTYLERLRHYWLEFCRDDTESLIF